MTAKPTFIYVTYIEATTDKVWHALTDADLTAEYWGGRNVSDWQVGSRWEHRRDGGSQTAAVAGEVLESLAPTRLVYTWAAPDAEADANPSRVTFDIEPFGDIVRLTVTHEDLADETARTEVANGWAAVVSNLKSMIETGHVLPQAPWDMPAR